MNKNENRTSPSENDPVASMDPAQNERNAMLDWQAVISREVSRLSRTFYVAPDGSDSNPGTLAAPFLSLEHARDMVRETDKSSGDIIVYLRAGVYRLSRTLQFDSRDSGAHGYRTIWAAYPGERVVISGGTAIAGWHPDAQGRWAAHTNLGNFRQLYVNGTRATRGRTQLKNPVLTLTRDAIDGTGGYTVKNPEMAFWRNPSDMELGFEFAWTHSICMVQAIRAVPDGVSIIMQEPCFYVIRHKAGIQARIPTYVENALELTTSPGQFYLDRPNHTVYYVPRKGEDMATAVVIAPELQTLLTVAGTVDRFAGTMSFIGITFLHTSWLGASSSDGFAEVQAAYRFFTVEGNVFGGFDRPSGGITLAWAENVRFIRCTFAHFGGCGVDIQNGASQNIISGARIFDISSNGVNVGNIHRMDEFPSNSRMVVQRNQVVDSYLHDTGVEYTGSVGIFAGYTDGTVLAHNELTRMPYTGISVGWGWDMQVSTSSRNNVVRYNHIHNVMLQRTDGGGIYTLGAMPGTLIDSNLVHDNKNPPGGIYLDEGSAGITVTNNVVFGEAELLTGFDIRYAIYYNNSAAKRATCSVQDNLLDDPRAAAKLKGRAGLEPEFQDLLR